MKQEALELGEFRLLPGGVFEWPGRLRISRGGGEEHAFPPVGQIIPAQPGGSLVLQSLGDYRRAAIDLVPTPDRPPTQGPLAELTIHRFMPRPIDQEMISYTALADASTWGNTYAVIAEAHGRGMLRPLVFAQVRGGYPTENIEPFWGEAMRMTEDGTMEFGRTRHGGRLKRPLESITIEQPEPRQAGAYNSDYLKWVAKRHDGSQTHRVTWRANVEVRSTETDTSAFVLENSSGEKDYAKKLEVTDKGDVKLPTGGAAIILQSPNGKFWRLSVSDQGALSVDPVDP